MSLHTSQMLLFLWRHKGLRHLLGDRGGPPDACACKPFPFQYILGEFYNNLINSETTQFSSLLLFIDQHKTF